MTLNLFELICLIVGFILFVLAGIGTPSPRFNLMAFGLAAWILVPLAEVINH